MSDSYHHGDLRRVLLRAAAEQVTESGAASLRLRELARRAGVSHAAPAHHFKDKTGLLTALAVEGYTGMSAALAAASVDGGLVAIGLEYIRYATTHPGLFEVMFSPASYRADDPAVVEAADAMWRTLTTALADGHTVDENRARAAWSIVHGFSTLWNSGALDRPADADPVTAAEPVIRLLFRP